MAKLVLEDCRSQEVFYRDQPEAIIESIGELNRQFNDGDVEIVSLREYNPRAICESPISYEIQTYTSTHYHIVADRCLFQASHYIGRYSFKGVDIVINPRFGDNVFNYLVSYATNLYIPLGNSGIANNNTSNSYWLIAIIWRAMLNKALTLGQIPKEYQLIEKNQKNYKGRLDISKHIRANLCDASKFYCRYKKLSMDNTINRTIRCTYKFLKEKGLSSMLSEFEEYDKRMMSLGVSDEIDLSAIRNVRYTRMTSPYLPVMNLSQSILKNNKVASSTEGQKMGCSYFIDIADLWEMYLLKVLQRNLPKEYRVYSPNYGHGDFLIEDNMREIRPDIIIEKEGRTLMIIDAKYKEYHSLGRIDIRGTVNREDLYQMSTYLYHFGKENNPIIGLFTSPTNDSDEAPHTLSHNTSHRIGLINLDVTDKDLDQVKQEENRYAQRICDLLQGIKP